MKRADSLAVVIPVYRAEHTLVAVVSEVFSALGEVLKELILVVDGSPDGSLEICRRLAGENNRIKFVSLRRNFGEHNAVLCGLNFVTAEFVAIMDDDAQHPALEVLTLLDEINKGFDVVFGSYQKKEHHWLRNFGSTFANFVASFLLNKPRNLYLSSFKIIRSNLLPDVVSYRGPYPYLDGLLLRVTNNFSTCTVQHRKRDVGASNYTVRRLVRLWLNMFLNFSAMPLRLILVMGLFFLVLGFALSLIAIIEWLVSSRVPHGYTSVFISIVMLSGVQLVSLGIIGEYLGKLFLHHNGTPQWIIKESSFATTSVCSKSDARGRVLGNGET